MSNSDTFSRLLATENITVVRAAANTASFDTESRTLTLPMFAADLDESVTTLFEAHEVGHALYTPRMVEVEPYRKDIEPNPSEAAQRKLQAVLNIVEDARIEKLIQREYPGLRGEFYKGYQNLIDAGFFGDDLQSRVGSLGFMDRLNIHAKAGAIVDVPFSAEEQAIVDKLDDLESFEDVAALVKSVYERDNSSQDEQDQSDAGDGQSGEQGDAEQQDDNGAGAGQSGDQGDEEQQDDNGAGAGQSEDGDEDGDEDGAGGSGDESGDDDGANGSESGEGDEDGEAGDTGSQSGESTSGEGDEDGDESDQAEASTIQKKGGLGEASESLLGGDITTESALSNAMAQSADTSKRINNYRVEYRGKKRTGVDGVIAEDKYVRDGMTSYMERVASNEKYSDHVSRYSEFMGDIKPQVAAMAQAFKRHQAASDYQRTRLAKTGVIDTNRLHAYKITDDVFRRAAEVQKGKSHGLVFFIDFSSSMTNCIFQTAKTTILLTQFCKAIRVPFEVYTFTTGRTRKGGFDASGTPMQKIRPHIVKLMSSAMSSRELSMATEFVYTWCRDQDRSTSYRERAAQYGSAGPIYMGGTPIGETLEIANVLIRDFKANNRVDIVTAIMLTDGEDGNGVHGSRYYYGSEVNNTTSKITGKTYTGVSYGNALIQDIRAAHNVSFINIHASNNFDLPMGDDNETGQRNSIAPTYHGPNSISEVKGVGGFNASYVIGFDALGAGKESRQFIQMLAKNFATDSTDWVS